MSEKLRAQIKAVNAANEAAAKAFPMLRDYFVRFIGQKVVLASGDLSKRVAKEFPNKAIEDAVSNIDGYFSFYRQTSSNSITYVFRSCTMIDDHVCTYDSCSVFIGDVVDQVLTNIADPPVVCYDWTFEKIDDLLSLRKRTQAVIGEINSELGPFMHFN